MGVMITITIHNNRRAPLSTIYVLINTLRVQSSANHVICRTYQFVGIEIILVDLNQACVVEMKNTNPWNPFPCSWLSLPYTRLSIERLEVRTLFCQRLLNIDILSPYRRPNQSLSSTSCIR